MMYLSWADDEGFNGGCVVPGDDIIEARMMAGLLGCRPEKGGQVAGWPVAEGAVESAGMEVGRLYSESELRERFGGASVAEIEADE